MSWYRRNYVPGGTYFFTVVTAFRRPLFLDEVNRGLFSQALKKIRAKLPFQTVAMVLLPDHLHAIWTLPRGDARYPRRWRQIKERFTVDLLGAGGLEGPRSASRIRHRERAIWQRRYWEHTVSDEDDLKRCVDYIHWNPKKHGLVESVADYPWSTFHRFVEMGEYTVDWGRDDPCPRFDTPEWADEM